MGSLLTPEQLESHLADATQELRDHIEELHAVVAGAHKVICGLGGAAGMYKYRYTAYVCAALDSTGWVAGVHHHRNEFADLLRKPSPWVEQVEKIESKIREGQTALHNPLDLKTRKNVDLSEEG